MRIAKLVSTALLAALALSAAFSTATARIFSFSNQNIRATWASLEFQSIEGNIRCPVTLEGSFHARTLAKVRGTLMGSITRAFVRETSCNGGRFLPKELPWHLTYESFVGALPDIASLRFLLSRFTFLIIYPTVATCEYGAPGDNVTISATREVGGLTTFTFVEGSNTVRNEAPSIGACPATGRLVGAGSLMQLGTTVRVRVTLI
jgi:hypothetical protein